jgi:hypothetical protein
MSDPTTPPTTTTRQVPISEAARVSELSHLCDTLTTEKAEVIRQVDALAVQVAELEREKAGLVEKLGDLTGERDYLRNALAAALTRPMQLPEKAEGPTPRPWWWRVLGG